MDAIANQCMGAPQSVPLCGERSPKGALPCSGQRPEQGMADFWATRRGNPHPRRETWQTGTTLGKFVVLFRICPRRCFLLCCAAGVTDCHVASLLAMTVGEVPSRPSALPPLTRLCLQRVIANHVPAPAHTSFLLHVIANQCAHWCGNPFSPQGNLANWHHFGQIRSTFPYLP